MLETVDKYDPAARGMVSLHSRTLLNTVALKQGWADELGVEIKDEVWDEFLKSIHDCLVNVKYNLIQFKTLDRLLFQDKVK